MSTFPTVQEELACVDWSAPYDGRSEYDRDVFIGDYGKGMKKYCRIVITDDVHSEKQKYLVAVDLPSEEELMTIRNNCFCEYCINQRDRDNASWYQLKYWFSPTAIVAKLVCLHCAGCIKHLRLKDLTSGDDHALGFTLSTRAMMKRNNKPK